MATGLAEQVAAFCSTLAGFDPSVHTGDDCAALAEVLAVAEKVCGAARVRAAARAAECRAHERRGFSDASAWLARVSGSSVGAAREALSVASALSRCPGTAEALAAGRLSLAQASVISRAETASAGSESELVVIAESSDMACLRDEGRKRQLAAADPEVLNRRQHRARHLRHWRDEMGMVRLAGALAPDVGVALVNRLEVETDRLRRAAYASGGEIESRAAYAADALVKLVAGGDAKRRSTSADVVVVCDLRAWRRGHAHRGEPCHVVGGGPVPVTAAKDLAQDAFVKAVTHDGVRIDTVAHFGRHIGAELRTALELGDVPGFEGVSCVEAGCGRRQGLEWDHVDPLANGGQTTFDNLAARCSPHHRSKTERDREAGLLTGTPGAGRGTRAPP